MAELRKIKGGREIRPGVWELRIGIGKRPDGSYGNKSVTVEASSPAQAERARARLVADVDAGKYRAGRHTLERHTVGELLDRWLAMVEADLSPLSVRTYKSAIKTWIRPALGARQLVDLDTEDLDELYTRMRQAGRAPKSIRLTHAVIARSLKQARRWRWMTEDPASLVTLPPQSKAKIEPPSPDEVERLVMRCLEVDPVLAVLVFTAIATGARRGELCALRWSDIDLAAPQLQIARSVAQAPGRLIEKDTKTHRIRSLRLPPAAAAVLRQHGADMVNRGAAAGETLPPDAFVFSRCPTGCHPLMPNAVTNAFGRIRDELGLTVRFHDLRHYSVSQQLAAGVDVVGVAGRHGHSNAHQTLVTYAHFIRASDDQAAAVMEGLLPTLELNRSADAKKPPAEAGGGEQGSDVAGDDQMGTGAGVQ